MRMRQLLFSGMIALLLSAVSAAAETYTIDDSRPTDQTANIYNSLEDLRKAINGDAPFTPISLAPGDTVILHNKDNTLRAPLAGTGFTIRSAWGSQYTVSSDALFDPRINVTDAAPALTVDGLHIVGSGVGSSVLHVESTAAFGLSGTLDISNSILENVGAANATGIEMINLAEGVITDTQILGTATSVSMNNTEFFPEQLDVVFTKNAGIYNKWDGVLEITGTAAVTADVNFDIAEGRYLFLGGVNGAAANLTLTGGGTLAIGVGEGSRGIPNAVVSVAQSLTVDRGTAHFGSNTNWTGDNLHIGAGGVFKPSIDFYQMREFVADPENVPSAGDISHFNLDTFTSEEGARLEIGNISTLEDYESLRSPGTTHINMFTIANEAGSNFASTLRIDNKLMKAYIREILPDEDPDLPAGFYLQIDDVNNLNTLTGVGSYADTYRHNPNLSQIERDMLDSIYARGGTSGVDLGFLQTVGGSIIQNSLLAVRHTQANVISSINRRLTAYQDEELATDELGISSSGLPAYMEEDPVNDYGEMWASLDHNWMAQDDIDALAGYEMSSTGLSIGYDWHKDRWIYGGMLSYSTGGMELASMSATKNDIDTLTAALYASWAEDGWYLSGVGIATYGWNEATSVYTLPGIDLSSGADFATSGLGLNIEAGHMLEAEYYGVPLRITPYGSLTYARHSRDAVDDDGAFGNGVDLRKRFAAADWNTWDAALGVRVAVPMEFKGVTVVPSVDLSWTRVTGQRVPEGGVVNMYNNPSASWDLDLMSSNRSSFRMIAGAEAMIKENMTLSANYELEWRRGYWNNRLGVNMSMDF